MFVLNVQKYKPMVMETQIKIIGKEEKRLNRRLYEKNKLN